MAKVWFLTGASSGLGEALAQAIIDKGDMVAATFRSEEQAIAFNNQHPERGIGLVLDVTATDKIKAVVARAYTHFGSIDVLVNNAGYGTVGAIEEFSLEEIRQQMETNFFGTVAVTKEVLPIMREKRSGHIVQLSSVSGIRALGGFGIYNASKFALEGFSEALAQEVAPFNIRVTIVEPGPFRTQFAGTSIKMPQKRLEDYQHTPVGTMYKYIQEANGKQEGDPVKGARAIVDFVYSDNESLRLPLGQLALAGIKAKLQSVQKDLEANEAVAASVIFSETGAHKS
ncbi:oxidoreductase [Flavisolibacter tropicus]|uniref:Short-chain dehydrogenase n=1 Tax=Flavisolibacter tropicus TaxID=1492898 RepID=A0A172TYK7_9BACT|nr:oxidoreductase [Flavisolibacter tropicus]ANE52072.1 short-chain dehydrogenase [Flavisolibacter tropicus]